MFRRRNDFICLVLVRQKNPRSLRCGGRWDGGGNLLTGKKLHEFVEFIQEIAAVFLPYCISAVSPTEFGRKITASALRSGEFHVDLSPYKEVVLRLRRIEPMASSPTVFSVLTARRTALSSLIPKESGMDSSLNPTLFRRSTSDWDLASVGKSPT